MDELSRYGVVNERRTLVREVSKFVVVFPSRFWGGYSSRRKDLMAALKRDYPQYTFDPVAGRPLEEDFSIIPVVGKAGGGEGEDPDQVYLCKPLDPRVIPDLLAKLRSYERSGFVVN